MLLLLGALGLACSPESAFSQEKAAAQAYAGKTVTGEVPVKQTVEDTLQSHRGLKVLQENLDVVRQANIETRNILHANLLFADGFD